MRAENNGKEVFLVLLQSEYSVILSVDISSSTVISRGEQSRALLVAWSREQQGGLTGRLKTVETKVIEDLSIRSIQ